MGATYGLGEVGAQRPAFSPSERPTMLGFSADGSRATLSIVGIAMSEAQP